MRVYKSISLALMGLLVNISGAMSQSCDSPAPLCYEEFNNVTLDTTGTGPLNADLSCVNPATNGVLYQVTTVDSGSLEITVDGVVCDTVGNDLGEELVMAVYDAVDPCAPTPGDLIDCQSFDLSASISLTADSAGQNFYVAIYGFQGAGDSGPADCGYQLQMDGEAVEFRLVVPSTQFQILLGQSVDMEGVTGVEEYLWSGGGEIVDDTMANPSITPNGIGTHVYTVTGTQGDCQVEEQVLIEVLPNVIPANVITPNEDGINDFWNIALLDERFDRADIRVFDRWGQEVFKSIGYASEQRWDGKNKGNVLPAGAYYYVIDLKTDESGEGPIFTGAVNIVY